MIKINLQKKKKITQTPTNPLGIKKHTEKPLQQNTPQTTLAFHTGSVGKPVAGFHRGPNRSRSQDAALQWGRGRPTAQSPRAPGCPRLPKPGAERSPPPAPIKAPSEGLGSSCLVM
uniref:Uncharacterized protein n=1 Tax=Athene cunicularia TaxID=194338 RepID=A0A663MKU2_ATHCN